MSMENTNTFKLSEEYTLRKCFFENQQVPTQSMIKKKMTPPLADIYFKSMSHPLKVAAGLEPSLKGGGDNWFIPPNELLNNGRVVLKPLEKEYMSKWNYYGVDEVGMDIVQVYRKQMKKERKALAYKSDADWSHYLEMVTLKYEAICSAEAAKKNTDHLIHAYREFDFLYTKSITKVQDLLFTAAVNKIQKYRADAFQKMQAHYEHLLHQQSNMLYDRYTKKLNNKKASLKKEFLKAVEMHNSVFGKNLHDIKVEQRVAVEKLRHYLECQTLACQVYVSLKEREECSKEIELSKYEHSKKIDNLKKTTRYKAFQIILQKEKERKRIEVNTMWQKKVCHVVKALQLFISYSLKEVPDQAEFFMNMEKLMLLQLSEALENPSADSIIQDDDSSFHVPIPQPRPYYLFCNKGSRVVVDSSLCPKHVTPSASQMPVIVINKRCIYAACDNFELFSDAVKAYIRGEYEGGPDIIEDDYTRYQNVTYTDSQQLRELKLESSLLQVLQQEIANLDKVPIECKGCQIAHCFDCVTCRDTLSMPSDQSTEVTYDEKKKRPDYKSITRVTELIYEREPKWDSYIKYIEPKKCNYCAKISKKHMLDHLPPYMRTMSTFDEPSLPNYETCSITTLKALVKAARRDRLGPARRASKPERTKEVAVQYSDFEFEDLCTCFSDKCCEDFLLNIEAIIRKFSPLNTDRMVGSISQSYISRTNKSFAIARALSLRQLIDETPQIEELFKNENCMSDVYV